MSTQVVSLVIAMFTALPAYADVAWPDFRGPGGQGIIESTDAPVSWSESENIAWKADVPGKGWSTPVVVDDEIWLTTAFEVQADDAELKKRAEGSSVANALALAKSLSLVAYCYDRHTGKQLTEVKLFEVDDPDPIHSLNSYASPSPVAEPGFIYCNFGCYGTACINTKTREIAWTATFEVEHYVGPGSSPVLVGDKLILTCDGADKQFVVAVNKSDGKVAWEQKRPPMRTKNPDMQKSYCTPLVATIGGREQAVIPGAQWVVSYDPATGKELWRVDHGSGFSLVVRQVTAGKHVFFCTGYSDNRLLCIDATGKGDVTSSHTVWASKSQVPNQPSLLLNDGKLFMVNDSGIAQCVDAATGDTIWKRRLSGGFSASPFMIDGEVFFTSREGVTSVVPADGTDEITRRNELDARLMATPIVLSDQILIRSESHLYSIE